MGSLKEIKGKGKKGGDAPQRAVTAVTTIRHRGRGAIVFKVRLSHWVGSGVLVVLAVLVVLVQAGVVGALVLGMEEEDRGEYAPNRGVMKHT